MAYRFPKKDTVRAGLRRIVRAQIQKALDEIRNETVHQVRKRCKRLRSLFRLAGRVIPAGCQ